MAAVYNTLVCLIVSLLLAYPAFAHGVGAGHAQGPCEAVRFYYSDGQPMAYAEVLVYGPGDAKVEFQNGRTDKNGVFAFVPDRTGPWRVVCNDGMGHRAEYASELVSGNDAKTNESPAQQTMQEPVVKPVVKSVVKPVVKQTAPLWLKALLGVSLLFNLALGIRCRRKQPKQAT